MNPLVAKLDRSGAIDLAAKAWHQGEAFEFAKSIVTLSEPRSVAAESIRALRTHIQSQHLQEGRRGIAICGASQGVGCTFIAVNLAVALSKIGVATLLIDANMREPGVDRFIVPKTPRGGLRDALIDVRAGAGEFIENEVLPNLSVLFAGQPASNAQELLAQERFGTVLNSCLRDYDATIVDTPPANTCADARRVSNVISYSLVVARKNQSLVSDVKTLVQQLEGDRATVIGTVLNEF
jgi:protein-tyrosine kinase